VIHQKPGLAYIYSSWVPVKGSEAKLKGVAKAKGLLPEPVNYILNTNYFRDDPRLV